MTFDAPRASGRMWTKPDFPYGRDYPDQDLWADEDGTVRRDDGTELEDEETEQ